MEKLNGPFQDAQPPMDRGGSNNKNEQNSDEGRGIAGGAFLGELGFHLNLKIYIQVVCDEVMIVTVHCAALTQFQLMILNFLKHWMM